MLGPPSGDFAIPLLPNIGEQLTKFLPACSVVVPVFIKVLSEDGKVDECQPRCKLLSVEIELPKMFDRL